MSLDINGEGIFVNGKNVTGVPSINVEPKDMNVLEIAHETKGHLKCILEMTNNLWMTLKGEPIEPPKLEEVKCFIDDLQENRVMAMAALDQLANILRVIGR